MLQPPYDKVLVTIEKKFTDKVGSLYIDTRFVPEQHVTTIGKVVAVPEAFSERIEFDGMRLDEVQVGDEVCFSYLVVFDKEQREGYIDRHRNLIIGDDGEEYWMVDLFHCFFVRRKRDDGDTWDIIPVGSYTVIEPVVTEQDSIGSFILPEFAKRTETKGRGIVRYTGEPLLNQAVLDLLPGDEVRFDHSIAQRYGCLNGEYFMVRQEDLMLRIRN